MQFEHQISFDYSAKPTLPVKHTFANNGTKQASRVGWRGRNVGYTLGLERP